MPIPFSLRQLEYFVAVAGSGSVTNAAAARNVSQPAISVAISELEAMLGRVLFHRQRGQRLKITPAGRRLLVQARSILSAAASITEAEDEDPGGRELSIACFRDLGPVYLPGLLTEFAREHPGVGFRITEGDLAEIRAMILDGRCDVALTYGIDLRKHGIGFRVIDRLAPHVILPYGHALTARNDVRLEDLVAERVIIEDFPVTIDYFIDMFRHRGLEAGSIQFVPSFELQRGLVANGWGVGLSCVRPRPDMSYDGKPIVCLPLSNGEPAQDVVIAHLGENTLSRLAHRFLAAAIARAGAVSKR